MALLIDNGYFQDIEATQSIIGNGRRPISTFTGLLADLTFPVGEAVIRSHIAQTGLA
jgi:hypothetical protein